MTIEYTEVTVIGNRVHMKMCNSLRTACHLQQELGAWCFAIPRVSLQVPFHAVLSQFI